MLASSGNECYKLGLSVKHYDHKHWLTKARKVMYDIQKLKYTQNPKYMELLKTTGKFCFCPPKNMGCRCLPEYSRDLFNIDKWSGNNRMGKCLMEIRDDN